jgi:hypothetical protein
MIKICRECSNKARQRPIPGKHEHGRARREEGPGSAISGRVDQSQGGCYRRGTTVEDDQAKESEGWPMTKE